MVDSFIRAKERDFEDCEIDPLFMQLPIVSARRCLKTIKGLPTGRENGADKKYEDMLGQLLPSLLYPYMDFADVQSRTESGGTIRDLIFYNPQSHAFLKEVFADYGSRQIVFEMKNVAEVRGENIDQINRYLTDSLGKFGVIVTRKPLKRAMRQKTIELWAGQRRAIVPLTDTDIEQMVEVFESKQRDPIDVLTRSHVQFRRECPQ